MMDYSDFGMNRIGRMSWPQKEAIVQFMEQNPEIGNEKKSASSDLHYRKQKWTELTKILNQFPGKPKSRHKWQKAWQDWRYNTRKKYEQSGLRKNLSVLEQRLLAISYDSLPKVNPSIETEENEEMAIENWQEEQNPSTLLPPTEYANIKQEIMDDNIQDILETRLVEYPSEQPSDPFRNIKISKIPASNQTRKRKKFVHNNTTSEMYKTVKYTERSMTAIRKICAAQAKTSSKLVSILEDNSRTLQSLAESQMRQAEALERQVSLEESRNSILKSIAATLSTLKKT